MGWDMPWYSAQDSLGTLLAPPKRPGRMHLVCYLRDGERVFETYWITLRGVEAMDYSYALMDLTVYGRQESWEGSPPGWPQYCSYTRTDAGPPAWPPLSERPEWPGGRPIAQWPRLEAGRSDDLGTGHDGREDDRGSRIDGGAGPGRRVLGGLGLAEGTFSICSFWYVEALARAGRLDEARLAFEKMPTYANHVGLHAEQISRTSEQQGNFPQAFTHLALISAAFTLDRALG